MWICVEKCACRHICEGNESLAEPVHGKQPSVCANGVYGVPHVGATCRLCAGGELNRTAQNEMHYEVQCTCAAVLSDEGCMYATERLLRTTT